MVLFHYLITCSPFLIFISFLAHISPSVFVFCFFGGGSMLCPFNLCFFLPRSFTQRMRLNVSAGEKKQQHQMRAARKEKKKIKTAKEQQKQHWVCWQAARGLEAECVTALWQLFVSGRFGANWCKRHSQGLLHESTCSWGVGSTPHSLLGLHSNLFYVGMQTSSAISKASGVFICVCSCCVVVKAEFSSV